MDLWRGETIVNARRILDGVDVLGHPLDRASFPPKRNELVVHVQPRQEVAEPGWEEKPPEKGEKKPDKEDKNCIVC